VTSTSTDTIQIRPDPNSNDEVWNCDRVMEKFGCRPDQLAMVLALAGDTSDGIDGVPRVGVKTAVKDLSACGWSIDHLLDIPKYAPHRQLILRNLDLIDLRNRAAPVIGLKEPTPFSPTKHGDDGWDDLLEFCLDHRLVTLKQMLEQRALWPET